MCLEQWKLVTDIVANVAIVVAGSWALFTYIQARKIERARWLKDLFEKFYEKQELKEVRDTIDRQHPSEIQRFVEKEPAEFTDYLNFFEFVGYLLEQGQVTKGEIIGLFDYYLRSLKNEPLIRSYIKDKQHGYEKLEALIETIQ